MMTLEEGFSYLEGFTNLEKLPDPSMRAYRLDRMERILEAFGNPHRSFKSLHVAGSKGKGTTSAYLAGGLQALGFKTGLYTSPHLRSYTERITLAGTPFPHPVYLHQIHRIRSWVEAQGQALLLRDYGQGPTTFELLTLLAFLIFQDQKMEWVVAEVGLGGRLDATNVLIPLASILTPIELEHTEILGTTLGAIAGEKAGIIKPGVPVFSAPQPRQAYDVFHHKAGVMQASMTYLPDLILAVTITPKHRETQVIWSTQGDPTRTLNLKMAGEVMAWNALLAHQVLTTILKPDEDLQKILLKGLEQVKLPGRVEYLDLIPPVVVDGAHTRRSCESLVKTLAQFFPPPRTLIFGAVEGKDWNGMAEVLAPGFAQVIITTPGSFKKSDPQALFKVFCAHHPQTQFEPDLKKAWAVAKELGFPTVVCGSFYLVADFLGLTGQ